MSRFSYLDAAQVALHALGDSTSVVAWPLAGPIAEAPDDAVDEAEWYFSDAKSTQFVWACAPGTLQLAS